MNKVAGNFHITAGKYVYISIFLRTHAGYHHNLNTLVLFLSLRSVPVLPRGHAHLAMMVKESGKHSS